MTDTSVWHWPSIITVVGLIVQFLVIGGVLVRLGRSLQRIDRMEVDMTGLGERLDLKQDKASCGPVHETTTVILLRVEKRMDTMEDKQDAMAKDIAELTAAFRSMTGGRPFVP